MYIFIDSSPSGRQCSHISIHLAAQSLRHITTFDEILIQGARIGSMSCLMVSLYGLGFWCTVAISSETSAGFRDTLGPEDRSRKRKQGSDCVVTQE